MTHKTELLAWFRRGLSITPAEAVDQWRNYRLADTVYRLREDGYNIRTEIMEGTSRAGHPIRFARYHFISGPKGEAAPRPMPTLPDCSRPEQEYDLLRRLRRFVFGY